MLTQVIEQTKLVLLVAQGENAAVRPYLEHALAIRKKVLGGGHPYTAQIRRKAPLWAGFICHGQP